MIAMHKIITFALASFLVACAADDTASKPDPVTPVSVVYPCSLQDDTCQAAYLAASSVCDRRLACDDLYDVDRTQCIAWEMEGFCTQATCYASGPYAGWDALNACVSAQDAATCDADAAPCHL